MIISFPESCTVEQARELSDTLRDACSASSEVSMDLSGVRDADLSLFQLLHATRKLLRDKGGSLTIRHDVHSNILRLVELTGLKGLLDQ